jgi:hypothetical protein
MANITAPASSLPRSDPEKCSSHAHGLGRGARRERIVGWHQIYEVAVSWDNFVYKSHYSCGKS